MTPVRVLIIEDDLDQLNEMKEYLDTSGLAIEFSEARHLRQAEAMLASADFDLVFCDMQIPSDENTADYSVDFGRDAYRQAVLHQPGVPRVFFSAFIDLDTIGPELEAAAPDDLYGDGERRPLTRQVTKDKGHAPCLAHLQEVVDGLGELAAVKVEGAPEPPLDLLEVRAVQIFARRLAGTSVHVEQLGGLSGSRALRVRVRDDQGREVARAFGKVGSVVQIEREMNRYEAHVVNRLPMESYAPQTSVVSSLIGRRRGVFYALADRFDRSLLSITALSDNDAAQVVSRIEEIAASWHTDDDAFAIRELRRERVADERIGVFLDEFGLRPLADTVEAIRIKAPMGIQHGDLHAENVLVDAALKPLLIDFADVARMPVGLDPLTLELSCVTHPSSPLAGGGWPAQGQLANWFDLDQYRQGCPSPEFIGACRAWLARSCPDPKVLAALVWTHAARQVKYDSIPHAEIAGLMRAAAMELGATS